MRALAKQDFSKGITLIDVDMPKVGDNDVLIKVSQAGICGTDLHIYRSDEWSRQTITPPTIIGHEFFGTIVELGKRVSNYKVGDEVTAEGHIVCHECSKCRTGQLHYCSNASVIGIHRDGAFAEYIAVPEENGWKHLPSTPRAARALFDPLGNAVHCALSFNMVGKSVLITGAGPIGVMVTAIVKYLGARCVVVGDPNSYRLDLARKMGATHTVNVKEHKLKQAIQTLATEDGFDIGLELSGSPKAIRDMIQEMGIGGEMALLGISSGEVTVDWNAMIAKGLTAKGIYGRRIFSDWYMMDRLIASGLDITPVVTHTFPYKAYEQAFETAMSGNAGKVILNWE